MRALFIGGTGTISSAVSALAIEKGIELYLLNRGNRPGFVPKKAKVITADINDEENVKRQISGLNFDVVADFIAFEPAHVLRDWRIFGGSIKQYIFISSASAYQKPLSSPVITESTPLSNPFWDYSRNKIACEEALMEKYRREGFPVTIVRPSHTYGDTSVPVAIHGRNGSFSVVERIRKGKKVIVHGDGTSLWTLTHNTDFAKAFVGIMNNPHAIGEAYNITSDELLTWNQIYDIIGSALGVKPRIVHIPSDVLASLHPPYYGGLLGDKAHSLVFDNTKIKRAVPGFAATVRFDQGVRQTLAYVYGNREYQKADPEFDAWCDNLIEAFEGHSASLPRLE
ncbi:MAG: SDR family oxidoreductase [Burkholderiales bacterium]